MHLTDDEAKALACCDGKWPGCSWSMGMRLIDQGLASGDNPRFPDITQAGLLALGRWQLAKDKAAAGVIVTVNGTAMRPLDRSEFTHLEDAP